MAVLGTERYFHTVNLISKQGFNADRKSVLLLENKVLPFK
jgi:hypothetical protein